MPFGVANAPFDLGVFIGRGHAHHDVEIGG
jgi:hypothetical protein